MTHGSHNNLIQLLVQAADCPRVTVLVSDGYSWTSSRPVASHFALSTVDLDQVLDASADDFSRFRSGRILLTGVTGFIGSWLLDTLLYADDRMNLNIEVEILVRDVARLAPHLRQDRRIRPLIGDVRTFTTTGQFDAVIHAAASSGAPRGSKDAEPMTMSSTVVEGTRNVLEASILSGSIPFLFLSSGAVYGPQLAGSAPIEETFTSSDASSLPVSYAEAKRLAESMCSVGVATGGPACVMARCFSFVGPRLPLDVHFAAGNFIADVLIGRPVKVLGDAKTVRSYLYMADLAIWLWRILARGEAGRAYNVGSERGISIGELAQMAAALVSPDHPVEIIGSGDDRPSENNSCYVPSTKRARGELDLEETISAEEGLGRMFHWYQPIAGSV